MPIIIRYPILQIAHHDKLSFEFGCGIISIVPYERNGVWANTDMILQFHKDFLEYNTKWELRFCAENDENHQEDINLLLLAFFTHSRDVSPQVRFNLYENNDNTIATISPLLEYTPDDSNGGIFQYELYDETKLKTINETYLAFRKACKLGGRAERCLYFYYQASHSPFWSTALLFYVVSLEALFSNDTPNGATSTIIRRVTNYLDDKEFCSKNEVCRIYKVRSNLVHGRLKSISGTESGSQSQGKVNFAKRSNLAKLKRVEEVVKAVLKRIVARKDFENFRHSRGTILKELDSK